MGNQTQGGIGIGALIIVVLLGFWIWHATHSGTIGNTNWSNVSCNAQHSQYNIDQQLRQSDPTYKPEWVGPAPTC